MICSSDCDVDQNICGRCANQLKHAPIGLDCTRSAGALDKIFAAHEYAEVARDLIKAMKYAGRTRLATTIAELVADRLPDHLMPPDCVLVPVPAHPTNARTRGFNQSLLIANALGGLTGCQVLDCLSRVGNRDPQSQLSRAQRLQLPVGEFTVNGPALRHRVGDSLVAFPTNVVVCDDVTTTTCTLDACASAIRERHSVQTIHGLAFASASL